MILRKHSHKVSTTSFEDGRKTVKITHPFIPQYRDEYEFVERKQAWGQDRVVYIDRNGQLAAYYCEIGTYLEKLLLYTFLIQLYRNFLFS